MYSGTTFTRYSGRILGAHQRIDRLARRQLTKITGEIEFPKIKEILQFEGRNGPDGIKLKSPAKDEPWHYYSPFKDTDKQLLEAINSHYQQLILELTAQNRERAAFEGAWLAHAIVDGLTPAHHFPYEEKLAELRGGESKETRTTTRQKLVMPGQNRREKFSNNWKMWGAGGLYMTHTQFEMGVATLLLPLKLGEIKFTNIYLNEARKLGIIEVFERIAKEIGILEMYQVFSRKGWTPKLAYEVRHKLAPQLVKAVTLAWYLAASEARLIPESQPRA